MRGGRERQRTAPLATWSAGQGGDGKKGVRWRMMLGEGLPGVSLDCPWKRRKKPRVRMLREMLQRRGGTKARHRAGQVKDRGITRVTGSRSRRMEGTGRAEESGLRATCGVGSRGRHGKEMVVEGGRGSMGQGTSLGTGTAKRWRGDCQQRRKASVAAGDEGMKVGNIDPPREDQDPRNQGLAQWATDKEVAAGQQGDGGHQKSGAAVKETEFAPGIGTGSGRGVQRRKRGRQLVRHQREHREGRHSSGFDAPVEGRRTAGVCWHPGGAEGVKVPHPSYRGQGRRLKRWHRDPGGLRGRRQYGTAGVHKRGV